jgi:outer membrane protein with beta-barrel domain
MIQRDEKQHADVSRHRIEKDRSKFANVGRSADVAARSGRLGNGRATMARKLLRVSGAQHGASMRPALLIVSLLFSAAAYSQPYASAHLGWAHADFPLGAPFNGYARDSSLMYGVDVGVGIGHRWAAELGFNSYDTFDGEAVPCAAGAQCAPIATQQSVNQRLYDAFAVRRFTIKDVRLFAKAGYYNATIHTDVPLADAHFHESGLALGIGLRWYFTAPWSVSLETTRYDDNLNQIVVGVGWGLGIGERRE